MSGSSKNLKLWLILAAVPIVLSFLIVGYAKYEYEGQALTASNTVDDWEPNERENERIARREVLDTEENSILLNISNNDSDQHRFLTPEYLEAEAKLARARSEIKNGDVILPSNDRIMVEDEKLEMDEEDNPVVYEVTEGEWLASIALKLYGSKAFWGYLYEVNRDMLNTPNDLKAGMELYLPNKEYYHIDSTNTQSIQDAAIKSAAFLNE